MIYVSKELRNFLLSFMNTIKISSASFEDKLDPVYREVDKDRINANYIRIIPSAIVLMLIEVCGLIYNSFTMASPNFSYIYIISFAVFFVFSISLLLFINHTMSIGGITDKEKRRIYIFFWIIYTLSDLAFCVFEMIDTGTTNHYMVFILTFTVGTIFVPSVTLPFYFTALLVELAALIYADSQYLTYVFCFLATSVGLVASYVKYSSYMSNNLIKKQLEQMAELDPMTGLLNRRGMNRAVGTIWDYCCSHEIPVTVAILDIDFFKMYNDTFGHSQGDECIKAIAECIKSCFGRRTDITVRYGGEEFVIVVSGESDKQVVMSLIKLQNMIEGMGIKSGNRQFNDFVTVSIGAYYTYIDQALDFKSTIKFADDELYNAKGNGRKCLSFKGELYNTGE